MIDIVILANKLSVRDGESGLPWARAYYSASLTRSRDSGGRSGVAWVSGDVVRPRRIGRARVGANSPASAPVVGACNRNWGARSGGHWRAGAGAVFGHDGASDHKRNRAACAAAKRNVTSNRAAASAPAQPSTYQTGAPNVAGGTPVAPQMASEMVISGADLNARPVTEPAEVLEAAPGLAVVQHSGSGKANQYYLRGYNLDHGTDMATFWDDVPINLPTNAHGQGYTDLNFLIPETISGLEVRKGPYLADVGDFDNAGD